MTNCPHMATCRMYPMFRLSGTLAVWKTNYCTGDFQACVRYRRATEASPVPDNLLPNGALLRREAGK